MVVCSLPRLVGFSSNAQVQLFLSMPFVSQVQHPAAKMIVMASHMQEQEVGDGTNFVLVFAGALLELAEELLRMGLSVSEVNRCSC